VSWDVGHLLLPKIHISTFESPSHHRPGGGGGLVGRLGDDGKLHDQSPLQRGEMAELAGKLEELQRTLREKEHAINVLSASDRGEATVGDDVHSSLEGRGIFIDTEIKIIRV